LIRNKRAIKRVLRRKEWDEKGERDEKKIIINKGRKEN
jgi:hypothetical protein